MKPALEVLHVTKSFCRPNRGNVVAVDDVTLKIEAGTSCGLVGESGCGKSTLANIIIGLAKPDKGTVFVNGCRVQGSRQAKQKLLYRQIQLVAQDPHAALNPVRTIGWHFHEVLVHARHIREPELCEKEIERLLTCVGLNNTILGRLPHQLSGGQKQRICIGLALSLQPQYLICDEAVSSLDVSIQAQILNLLRQLQREMNLTYLFISHDLNVVTYLCDYIYVMQGGKIVEAGLTEKIINSPREPYTKNLFAAARLAHQ